MDKKHDKNTNDTHTNVGNTGSTNKIQIDQGFVSISEIGSIITAHQTLLPENLQPKFIVIIKADKNVEMGLISNVKQELRKINVLKIQYSTIPKWNTLANLN